jgi:hypothetical protein
MCVLLWGAAAPCYLEMLPDRFMHRSRESADRVDEEANYHYDISPSPGGGDVFGGWLNLDDDSQHVILVPGSHNTAGTATRRVTGSSSQGVGYVKVTDPETMARRSRDQAILQVPPGALLVFYEIIYHTLANPVKSHAQEASGRRGVVDKAFPMRRLFTGWHLSPTLSPLHRDLEAVMREGKPLNLKGLPDARPPVLKQGAERAVLRLIDFGSTTLAEPPPQDGYRRQGQACRRKEAA